MDRFSASVVSGIVKCAHGQNIGSGKLNGMGKTFPGVDQDVFPSLTEEPQSILGSP